MIMMGVIGYKSKKALKESIGTRLRYVETSLFGAEYHGAGEYIVVGPDAYNDRRFFATVTTDANGIILKVK